MDLTIKLFTHHYGGGPFAPCSQQICGLAVIGDDQNWVVLWLPFSHEVWEWLHIGVLFSNEGVGVAGIEHTKPLTPPHLFPPPWRYSLVCGLSPHLRNPTSVTSIGLVQATG